VGKGLSLLETRLSGDAYMLAIPDRLAAVPKRPSTVESGASRME